MNELIKIQEHNNQMLVDARELHAFLGSKQDFSNWIRNRIEKYGFIEGQDFTSFNKIIEREKGGTTRIEYALTTDMAKELCMIENNEKGKVARQYFIQKEKEANSRIALSLPTRKELALMVVQAEEQIEELELMNSNQAETIKKLLPKAEVFDIAMQSKDTMTLSQAGKVIEYPFGLKVLCAKLREHGIFYKHRNEPRQEYIANGYFRFKEKPTIMPSNNRAKIYLGATVTQKGLVFLRNRYGKKPTELVIPFPQSRK
jgi:anti-repressor protein